MVEKVVMACSKEKPRKTAKPPVRMVSFQAAVQIPRPLSQKA